jgi:hypothetical protein
MIPLDFHTKFVAGLDVDVVIVVVAVAVVVVVAVFIVVTVVNSCDLVVPAGCPGNVLASFWPRTLLPGSPPLRYKSLGKSIILPDPERSDFSG